MGVKHFFSWFRREFPKQVTSHIQTEGGSIDKIINTLLLDLNGIFHTCAAHVYQYGPHKRPQSLLRRNAPQPYGIRAQIQLFQEICQTIEKIVDVVKPIENVVLCIDGVAPQSKQAQQRSRRFRTAMEREDEDFQRFDSNCITPGTKFLMHLRKYIDWWLRQKVSHDWSHLKIIFSGDDVPGEGEHKLITYLRQYNGKEESCCVYGVDADLIMLSLGTMIPNFYLLRENMHNPSEYFVVNVGETREKLIEKMMWERNLENFDERSCIYDFIFLCFASGNDFLPHIPSIEIIEGGLETMIMAYREVGSEHGHITESRGGPLYLRPKALKSFLEYIAEKEEEIMKHKLERKDSFFPDQLLMDCSILDASKGFQLNFNEYLEKWTAEKFGEDTRKVSHDYFEGLHWVLNYYIQGVPTWTWLFPYHYAPFARTLLKHLSSYRFVPFRKSEPNPPFLQLLTVLPPKSSGLLPAPLNTILTDKELSISKYYPEKIEIDITGRMKEWEGIALAPFVDLEELRRLYYSRIRSVEFQEIRRNMKGRNITYVQGKTETLYQSFYGNITVKCMIGTIEF